MPTRYPIMILLLVCSCANDNLQNRQAVTTETAEHEAWIIDTVDNPLPENIRFDYSAAYYDSFKTIEVEAIIYNENSFPLYFRKDYCDFSRGLLYDTSILEIAGPVVYGNACRILKEKIAAHGTYKFHEHLTGRTRLERVKLGFQFTLLPPEVSEDSMQRIHFRNSIGLWAERPINTETAYQRSHMADHL